MATTKAVSTTTPEKESTALRFLREATAQVRQGVTKAGLVKLLDDPKLKSGCSSGNELGELWHQSGDGLRPDEVDRARRYLLVLAPLGLSAVGLLEFWVTDRVVPGDREASRTALAAVFRDPKLRDWAVGSAVKRLAHANCKRKPMNNPTYPSYFIKALEFTWDLEIVDPRLQRAARKAGVVEGLDRDHMFTIARYLRFLKDREGSAIVLATYLRNAVMRPNEERNLPTERKAYEQLCGLYADALFAQEAETPLESVLAELRSKFRYKVPLLG